MNKKSPITTHVLDTSLGCPAKGIAVRLDFYNGIDFQAIATGNTDDDGRIIDLLKVGDMKPGHYRIHFDTKSYFATTKRDAFFPAVTIDFEVANATQHYHVPLLLSPFGYSTYRGS